MQGDKPKQRPKTLADVGLRFPPPPGTRFYVNFAFGLNWDGRSHEEYETVVADSPKDALELVLRDGKGPTNPYLRCAHVIWFDHNGNARTVCHWLTHDELPMNSSA
jgi:hypothetical protein